ncbi:constitutive coactivator of peroxisome proliferator-activated receptor gamma-like [Cryptotermes secundus]|uniref:constitutive coactivator of peroxisome proliferator-activated receptor gamma-like n=1 Tax=Cryptotermes secundus TaxID=105785 RepID=UPI000CD7D32C|nr:constitutive coactivator of peroxisome proliferator-activated receptor gamma-like [Cryptotermes secundus]
MLFRKTVHVCCDSCTEHTLVQNAEFLNDKTIGIPHPGLLTLWNKESEELQWKVFCAAVSPRLDPKLLRELPPRLVIPAASLTYLCHELDGKGLEFWEAESLIIQAVILKEYDTEVLSKLKVPDVYTRAVRISTLFMRTAFIMMMLLASCGYPITIAETLPFKYFDGKLFGCVYHKTKLGTNYEDQCSHKAELMDWYLKVRQIVCGHLEN